LAKPVTGEQGEFDVESVVTDWAATTLDCPLHSVLHGIEVQAKFVRGRLVAGVLACRDRHVSGPLRLAMRPPEAVHPRQRRTDGHRRRILVHGDKPPDFGDGCCSRAGLQRYPSPPAHLVRGDEQRTVLCCKRITEFAEKSLQPNDLVALAGVPRQPQHQPQGVVYECQRHRRQYGEVEQLLELVTNLGLEPQLPTIVINGQSTEVAGPISTVQQWCAQCPFQRGCHSKMTTAVRGYTGIAGGTILHQGKPYSPRRGRVKRSRR
jgi:hypothetical protein